MRNETRVLMRRVRSHSRACHAKGSSDWPSRDRSGALRLDRVTRISGGGPLVGGAGFISTSVSADGTAFTMPDRSGAAAGVATATMVWGGGVVVGKWEGRLFFFFFLFGFGFEESVAVGIAGSDRVCGGRMWDVDAGRVGEGEEKGLKVQAKCGRRDVEGE